MDAESNLTLYIPTSRKGLFAFKSCAFETFLWDTNLGDLSHISADARQRARYPKFGRFTVIYMDDHWLIRRNIAAAYVTANRLKPTEECSRMYCTAYFEEEPDDSKQKLDIFNERMEGENVVVRFRTMFDTFLVAKENGSVFHRKLAEGEREFPPNEMLFEMAEISV